MMGNITHCGRGALAPGLLFCLARPVAATKLEMMLAARFQRTAFSLAISVQLLHQHREHAFDFSGLLRQLLIVVGLD